MSMQPILVIEIFDLWEIHFMEQFPSSYSYLCNLFVINYIS